MILLFSFQTHTFPSPLLCFCTLFTQLFYYLLIIYLHLKIVKMEILESWKHLNLSLCQVCRKTSMGNDSTELQNA